MNECVAVRGPARAAQSSEAPSQVGVFDVRSASAAATASTDMEVEVAERGGLLTPSLTPAAIMPPLEQAPAFDIPAAQAVAVATVRPSPVGIVSADQSAFYCLSLRLVAFTGCTGAMWCRG